jgi:hypothetical protein
VTPYAIVQIESSAADEGFIAFRQATVQPARDGAPDRSANRTGDPPGRPRGNGGIGPDIGQPKSQVSEKAQRQDQPTGQEAENESLQWMASPFPTRERVLRCP